MLSWLGSVNTSISLSPLLVQLSAALILELVNESSKDVAEPENI